MRDSTPPALPLAPSIWFNTELGSVSGAGLGLGTELGGGIPFYFDLGGWPPDHGYVDVIEQGELPPLLYTHQGEVIGGPTGWSGSGGLPVESPPRWWSSGVPPEGPARGIFASIPGAGN
jgi:hypothetical protein